MRSEGVIQILLVLLLAALVPATARAVEILSSSRSARINATLWDPVVGAYYYVTQQASAPNPTGPWTVDLVNGLDSGVEAFQDSLVSQTELSSTGSVRMILTSDGAQTLYHVVFAVDAITPYEFSLDNVAYDLMCPACWSYPGGSFALDRVDPTDPSLVLASVYDVFLGPGGSDVAEQGALAPGTYVLDYSFHMNGTHVAEYPGSETTSFSLQFLPEPGAAVLLMSALVGLGAWRKRHASPV